MRYLSIAFLLALPSWADEIQTKDGKKVEFKTLTDEGEFWDVTTPQGTKVTIKKTDFDKLIPSGQKDVPLTGAQFTFDKKRKLETVDLLTKLPDLKKDAIGGTWKLAGGALVLSFSGEGYARLPIPYTPPEEYDLAMTIERKEGDVDFLVGLVGGGKQFAVQFDAIHSQVSGLSMIDGKGIGECDVKVFGKFFEIKKPRTLIFMIRREAFIMQSEGKDVLAWKADWNRISLNPAFQTPAKNSLFLGVWGSTFQIAKMTLTTPKDK